MCPYRSMSRNHLYYYASWPHWVLNIDTFSVELITKSTLTIRTHCLATSSLLRGTIGCFTYYFWSSPFLSSPIPIPAFHMSTGTLWNPFLHFRFIDQHRKFILHRMNGRIEVSPWRVIVWWNDSCKQRVEERILSDLLRRPISIIVSLSKTQLFSIHPFKCQLIQWFTLSLLVESLRMELEWFIGILSLFDDHLKWVVFAHLGSFSISIIALLIPLIQWWFHFYGPNEVWNGCVRCFDIVEVKELLVVEWTLLLENRIESLFTECVACLIVTSCDVESIDEFVCERKWSADSVVFSWSTPIIWVWKRNHANLLFLGFSIPIHSASLPYHLHRLALESHNCNHHHSFSFSSYLIQSIASFPSTQLIPIHHNDPSSIESP